MTKTTVKLPEVKLDLAWLTAILAILKLTGIIHISWFWVFSPLILTGIILLFGLFIALLGAVIALAAAAAVITKK